MQIGNQFARYCPPWSPRVLLAPMAKDEAAAFRAVAFSY